MPYWRPLLIGCFCWSVSSVTGCATAAPTVSGVIDQSVASEDGVRLIYLGTGGWIFERGDDQVIAAPLFSNPGLVKTGLLPIRSDSDVVDEFMSRYDVSEAHVILVGHAHYDHLMDVPRVALEHAPRARILGSRTVKNTLGSWSGVGERVDEVNDLAGDQSTVGTWLSYGPGVRVMALRSFHAPHFEGYTLFKGTRVRSLNAEPRWATEWLDGTTHAYLVDFLNVDGSVAFRIYYQDAVAPPPFGFAPEAVIRERPVDAAILVPATFDQVDWHPEAFVENLQPQRVLMGHWENFFSPPVSPADPLSNFAHFENRLERVFDGEWWKPELWTEFRFPTR